MEQQHPDSNLDTNTEPIEVRSDKDLILNEYRLQVIPGLPLYYYAHDKENYDLNVALLTNASSKALSERLFSRALNFVLEVIQTYPPQFLKNNLTKVFLPFVMPRSENEDIFSKRGTYSKDAPLGVTKDFAIIMGNWVMVKCDVKEKSDFMEYFHHEMNHLLLDLGPKTQFQEYWKRKFKIAEGVKTAVLRFISSNLTNISKTGYLGTLWYRQKPEEAIKAGLFTPYSFRNIDEDIAETSRVGIFGQDKTQIKDVIQGKNNSNPLNKRVKAIMNYYYLVSGGLMDEQYWYDLTIAQKEINIDYWKSRKQRLKKIPRGKNINFEVLDFEKFMKRKRI